MSERLHVARDRTSGTLFGRRPAPSSLPPAHHPDGGRGADLVVLSREISEAAASVTGLAQALMDERACEPLGLNQGRAVEGVLTGARRLMALAQDLADETAAPAPVETAARLDLALALHASRERQAVRLLEAGVRAMGPGPAPGPSVPAPAAAVAELLDGLLAAAAGLAGPGGALILEARRSASATIEIGVMGEGLDEGRLADSLAPGGDLTPWRRSALRFGAELRIRPTSEMGAAITLTLPGEASGPALSSPLPRLNSAAGIVLLVGARQADRTLIRLVSTAIRLPGLYTAEDAEAGLEMARTLQPDVVILDLAATQMDAVRFARVLAADPVTCGARRLALHGDIPGAADRRRLREAGYRHVLARPLDVGDLAHAFHACLKAETAKA